MYIRYLFMFYLIRVQVTGDPPQFSSLERSFIYNNTYSYDATYNISVNAVTQHIMDFIENNERWSRYPSRVHFECSNVDPQQPLFITAMQQKGVVSWELPDQDFGNGVCNMTRTLCPNDADSLNAFQTRPTLQLSTFSIQDISVAIKVQRVTDFFIEIDKEINVSVTPTTPKYYYFSFVNNPWNWTTGPHYKFNAFPNFNYTIPKSVILMLNSDDDLCAEVSVQNASCPVLDDEREVRHQGYHFTMTKRGGITLTQSMFPSGFYIVVIVKQDQSDCEVSASESDVTRVKETNKIFKLKVIATISYEEYFIAAMLSLVAVIVFFFFIILFTCSCACKEEITLTEEIITPNNCDESNEPGPSDGTDEQIDHYHRVPEHLESSSSEECLLTSNNPPTILTVEHLSRRGCIRIGSRSQRYLWSLLTLVVVYTLPVIQLLGTYQNMVLQTGDQDLCYYNFLCAHPLGFLSDFNHVFSNLGYIFLGLLFMCQVWVRQRHYYRLSPSLKRLGIPPHFGLLHGLGVALAAEGLLSACYHLCPNHMNFQFDSSFMYVTAILSMIKLYQNRHPDINARAHHTFTLIAFVFALGLLGTLQPSVTFWVAFTILHLLVCLLLTVNIYYMGKFSLGMWNCNWTNIRELAPRYRARAVLLFLANIANWALAAYGVVEHNKDFARHLLAILLSNTILYTLFYVCMKLLHRERLYIHTWLYFVGALLVWFGALYLFLDSKTKWSESPAASRVHNAPCTVLHFYDSHDLWHLASAAAMFLCYNLLLTVDDALHLTPRNEIPVF